MTKTIEYKIPAMTKKGTLTHETRKGRIAHIFFGAERIKCVLQYREDVDGELQLDALVHYASGQIIAPLANRKLALYVRNPYSRYSDREIAEMAVAEILSQKTPDFVRGIFAAAPVVNQ